MAQRERTPGGSEVRDADQATRDLLREAGAMGPMIPRPEAGGASATRDALQRADQVAQRRSAELNTYAGQINRLLLSGAAISQGVVGREVSRIMGDRRTSYPQEIREIESAARMAAAAREDNDMGAAQRHAARARSGIEALAETDRHVMRLEATGANRDLISGVKASFYDSMRDAATPEDRRLFTERRRSVIRAANMRAEYDGILSSPQQAQTRELIDQTITVLGAGAMADQREGARTSERFNSEMATQFGQQLTNLETGLGNASQVNRFATSDYLHNTSAQYLTLQGAIGDENLKRQINDLRSRLDDLEESVEERTERGEDVRDAEVQIAYVAAAQQIFRERSGREIAGQEEIIGNGLAALRLASDIRAMDRLITRESLSVQDAARRVLGEGATDEQVNALVGEFNNAGSNRQDRERTAQGLTRRASLNLFLARQYDSATSANDRTTLLGLSRELANGTKTMSEVAQALGGRLAGQMESLTGERRRGRIRDPAIAGMLNRMAGRLREGTPSIADLQRASTAVRLGREFRAEESALGGRAFSEIRNEALGIFRRSFRALETGAPPEIAQAQFNLGTSFRRALRNPELRTMLSAMSGRLEMGTNLLAIDGMVNHPDEAQRISAAEAARRVLEGNRPGEEVTDREVAELVTQYERAGAAEGATATREQRGNFIQGIFRSALAFDQLLGRRDAIVRLKSRAPSQSERGIYQTALDSLEGVLGRLSRGEQVSQDDITRVQAQAVMLTGRGNQSLIANTFVTSREPAVRQEQLEMVQDISSLQESMRGLTGAHRTRTARIYQRGMEALAEGRLDDALSYFNFAQAYARSTVAADRSAIETLVTRYGNSSLPEAEREALAADQQPITAEAARFLSLTYRERAEARRGIRSSTHRATYLEYSDLTIRAFQNGDTEGARRLRSTTALYGRAAQMNSREEAVAATLRISEGNSDAGIPSLEQLRTGIVGDTPQTLAQILGATEEAQTAVALERYALGMLELEIGLNSVDYSGRESGLDSRRALSRYTAEGRRLDRLIARAESAGDQAEVERLTSHRQIADREAITEGLGSARTNFEAGQQMMHRSIALRRQALEATDAAERRRLLSQANSLHGRATMLLETSEGQQASLLGIHRSVTRVFTIHRERGRRALDRAGDSYRQAGDGLREAEGTAIAAATGRARILVRSGNRTLTRGSMQVGQQVQIQGSVWRLLRQAEQLTDQNETNGQAYADVNRPDISGIAHRGDAAYDQAAIQRTIDRGRRAARGENLRGASYLLGRAGIDMRASAQVAVVSMSHRRYISTASPREREGEHGMDEYDTAGYISACDMARRFAAQGNFTEADRRIAWARTESIIAGRRQELHNGAYMLNSMATEAARQGRGFGNFGEQYIFNEETNVLSATLKQSADQRAFSEMRGLHNRAETEFVEAARRAGREHDAQGLARMQRGNRAAEQRFLSSHEGTGRPPDMARIRALRHNVEAMLRAGGIAELQRDASAQATSLRARATALEDARDEVYTVQDVPGATGDNIPELLVRGLNQMETDRVQRQRSGRGTLGDLGTYGNQTLDRAIIRARDLRERARSATGARRTSLLQQASELDAGVMRYFNGRPRIMRQITRELESRELITSAARSGLDAMAGHYTGMREYQEHTRGWNVSVAGAERFLETTSAADALRRARPHGIREGMVRQRLISRAERFLQIHNYAAGNAGRVGDDIRTGRTVRFGSIGGGESGSGLVVRQGDNIYDDRVLRAPPREESLADFWRETVRGVYDDMAHMTQGMGEEAPVRTAEDEAFRQQVGPLAYRLMTLHHPTSVKLTDMDVRAQFALWGFDVDPRTGDVRGELRLSAEEMRVLSHINGSVAQARGQMLNVASTLKTFASSDDARRAMSSLEIQMDGLERNLGTVVALGTSAERSDGIIRNPLSRADADGYIQGITGLSRTADANIQAHVTEGMSDDKVVLYTTIGLKIVGYGAMALSGYGLPAAVIGLYETWTQSREQEIMMGGTEQMTDLELGLRYGSYAIAGLGVVTAGASSVVGAFSSEAVAASRLLQGMQQATRISGYVMIGGGVALGAGEITNMALYGGADVGILDYAFAGFNAAQPFLQIGGMHAMRMSPRLMHSTSTGARAYRGFMGLVFGVGRREIIHGERMAMRQQAEMVRLGRARGAERQMLSGLGSGRRPRGISQGDFQHAQQRFRQLVDGGMSPRRAARRVSADAGRARADADATAIAGVERQLSRSLEPHERISLLEHYSGEGGTPRAIDPQEAVGLLNSYRNYVDGQVQELSPAARTRLAQMQVDMQRPFEPGEMLAIVREYGSNIPEVGTVARFLDRTRRAAAGTGRSPFYTLSDHVEMQRTLAAAESRRPGAPAPVESSVALARLQEAAMRRDQQTAVRELEGGMNLTLTSGEETRYSLPGEARIQYSREQMHLARDVAAAADVFVREGALPADTPPAIARAARALAGSGDTAFRRATSGQTNRAEQMRIALAATDEMPAYHDAAMSRGIERNATLAAEARDLSPADATATRTRADQLAQAYSLYRTDSLSDAQARTMGVGADERIFFRLLQQQESSGADAGVEMARYAASERRDSTLATELGTALESRLSGRPAAERNSATLDAQRLAEAYHEYGEAMLASQTDQQRTSAITAIRQRYNITDGEHDFLTVRSGYSPREMARDIALRASGEPVAAPAVTTPPAQTTPAAPRARAPAGSMDDYVPVFAAREARARGLAPAEQQATTVRAQQLQEAYEAGSALTDARARQLNVGREEQSLFRILRDADMSDAQIASELGRHAAAERSETTIDAAVESSVTRATARLPARERSRATVRGQALAEALHEYREAERTHRNPRMRSRRIDEVRQRLGLSPEEHGFLMARSGLPVTEVAADIGRLVAGQSVAPRAARPRPTPASRTATAARARRALARPEPVLELQRAVAAAEFPEIAEGRTIPSGARARVEGQERWENGAILGHVEDAAIRMVQRNAGVWETALGSGRRPVGVDATDFLAAQASVRQRTSRGMGREQAIRAVAAEQASMEAIVVAVDKSGLNDISQVTHGIHGTREGHSPADVISKELFEHMINRAGAILRDRGYPIAADALLGTGRCDERALVVIGRRGGQERAEVVRALAIARLEVNAQLDPSLRPQLEQMGGRMPTIPETHLGDVATARTRLRELRLQRRAEADQAGQPFQQITDTDETRILTQLGLERVRRRFGGTPTEEQIREHVPGEVAELRRHLRSTDLRSYGVEIGDRSMTLHDFAQGYLEHPELVGAFSADVDSVTITPSSRRGAGRLHQAYVDAESSGAQFSSPVRSALRIGGRSGLDEHLGTMPAVSHGDVNMPGMRVDVEGGNVTLHEGEAVQIFFRLTEDGRTAVAQQLSDFVRSSAEDTSITVTTETMDAVRRQHRTMRPEIQQQLGRIMTRLGVNAVEALQLSLGSHTADGISVEYFAEVVTRKAYTFGRGDISFSEGNTFLGHDAMNVLAQIAADGMLAHSSTADGSSARALGNLAWLMPQGSDTGTLATRLNRVLADAGITGITADVRTMDITGPTSLRDVDANLAGQALGRETPLDRATFTHGGFLVHLSHIARRGGDGPLMHTLFGDRAAAVQSSMEGLTGSPGQIYRTLVADTSPAGRQRLRDYLLYSVTQEVRGRRALRRFRDVETWMNNQIRESPTLADTQFYTAMRDEFHRYARSEGPAAVTRYREYRAAGGRGPTGPGRGRRTGTGTRGAETFASIRARSGARQTSIPPRGQDRRIASLLGTRDSRGRPTELAGFARRAVLATPEERTRMLETLPLEVRSLVEPLLRDSDPFAQSVRRSASQGNDTAFNNYVDRFGSRRLRGIADSIGGMHPPEPDAASIPMARTGTDDAHVDVVGPQPEATSARPGIRMVRTGPEIRAAGSALSPAETLQPGAAAGTPGTTTGPRATGTPRGPAARSPGRARASAAATITDADTFARTRIQSEVVGQHSRLRRMTAEARAQELAGVTDLNRKNALTQMLALDEGDPAIARLAQEHASAEVELQRARAERTAVTTIGDQTLASVMRAVAAGESNPTFEWLVRDIATGTRTPEGVRRRLLAAYQTDGAEGFRRSLGIYQERDVTSLLAADQTVQGMVAEGPPTSAVREFAAARGVAPDAMQQTLRAAYQRDGVTGVLNEILGTPRADGVNFQELFASLPRAEQRVFQTRMLGTFSLDQLRGLAAYGNITGGASLGRDVLVQRLSSVLGNAGFRAELLSMVPATGQTSMIPQMLLRRRAGLAQQHPRFVEVLLQGNLEGRIRAVPGMENLTITDVTHRPGSVGNYMVELSDGRRIFMKPEDHRPAQLGARRLEAQGLAPTARGMHTFTYDTGLVDASGRRIHRDFGFSEDIHAFGSERRSIRIRMPDDSFQQVTTRSVAMLSDEVFTANLSDPAVRARLQRTGALEAAEHFQSLARTPEGRAQIARAWTAYLEMSRRALVVDRAPRNTAIFLVEGEGGVRQIVFQPIDTDFVAGKIGSHEGTTDFISYDMDFGMATNRFVVGMDTMLGDQSPGRGSMAGDIVIANETRTLSDPPEVRAAMDRVTREADGQPFGYPMPGAVGDMSEYGGRTRVLQRGRRFILHADEVEHLSREVMGADSVERFRTELRNVAEAAGATDLDGALAAAHTIPDRTIPDATPRPPATPAPLDVTPTIPQASRAPSPEPSAVTAPAQTTPRRQPTPARRVDLHVEASQLVGRRIVHNQTTDPDAAGRTFHVLTYTDDGNATHTISVDGTLSGRRLLSAVDAEVSRINTREAEALETALASTGTHRPRQELATAVSTLQPEAQRGDRRLWNLAVTLESLALSSQDTSAMRPEYRGAVAAIRRRGSVATDGAQETYFQAQRILDQRASPRARAGALDLVALAEGRRSAPATDGERVVLGSLQEDPRYRSAMESGDRATVLRVAQEYSHLAAAADRVIAPPELVRAEHTRLQQLYTGDAGFRNAVDTEATRLGVTPADFMQSSARDNVIVNETRRVEIQGGFDSVLIGRSMSSSGNTVSFADPFAVATETGRLQTRYRDDAAFRADIDQRAGGGGRRATRLMEGMARESVARTDIPEADYTSATRIASAAEGVVLGRTRLRDVPEADRARVAVLVEDPRFVRATNNGRFDAGGQSTGTRAPNRAEQLALAFESSTTARASRITTPGAETLRVRGLVRQAGSSDLSSLDAFDSRIIRSVRRLEAAGMPRNEAITLVSALSFRANILAATTTTGRNSFGTMFSRVLAAREQMTPGTSRQAVAFDILFEVGGEGQRLAGASRHGAPTEAIDRFGYEVAVERARQMGRTAPIAEDFEYGAMARTFVHALDTDIFPARTGVAIASDAAPGESPHIDLYAASEGGVRYRLRVREDGAYIIGASAEALGGHTGFTPGIREAFIRYANARLGPRLNGQLSRVREQIARGNLGMASMVAGEIAAGRTPGAVALVDTHQLAMALGEAVHPQRRQQIEAFLRMSSSEQSEVIRDLRASARQFREEAAEHIRAGRGDAGTLAQDRNETRYYRAVQLEELQALNGTIGQEIEGLYGLEPGTLARVYGDNNLLNGSRSDVMRLLGITVPQADDHDIFGMLITGNLVSVIRDMYPNATAIEMRNIGGGVTGAYMLRVTDPTGTHMEFVKSVDMRADQAGAVNILLSGVPAPTVITGRGGRALTYARRDGSRSAFGVTRNLGAFDGSVRIGGRDIQLRARTAASFDTLQNHPELMQVLMDSPEVFFRALGYTYGSSFALGSLDGHAMNVFGMIVDVPNPTPENLAALRGEGHTVFRAEDGSHRAFMVGRIDTDDSAGAYWATGSRGNFDFGMFRHRLGAQMYYHLFAPLARQYNIAEMRRCGPWRVEVPTSEIMSYRGAGWTVSESGGRSYIETYNQAQLTSLENAGLTVVQRPTRAPRFVSPRGLARQAFGSGGDGAFYQGVRSWYGSHASDPAYRAAVTDSFRRTEGQPVGVSSFKLETNQASQLTSDGVTYNWFPTNGEERMLVFHRDGRGVMMSDYERASVEHWPQQIQDLFPHRQQVFIAPYTEGMDGMAGTFYLGRRQYAVFSREQLPPALRESAIPVVRHHTHMRGAPGLGQMTGLPTETMGAVHVFDHIMNMGEGGLMNEFRQVQSLYNQTEMAQENAQLGAGANPAEQDQFLRQRLPDGFDAEAFPTRTR